MARFIISIAFNIMTATLAATAGWVIMNSATIDQAAALASIIIFMFFFIAPHALATTINLYHDTKEIDK